MNNVVEIAPHMAPRDCRDCTFSSIRMGDTFCEIYDQFVISERLAADGCPMWNQISDPSLWRSAR